MPYLINQTALPSGTELQSKAGGLRPSQSVIGGDAISGLSFFHNLVYSIYLSHQYHLSIPGIISRLSDWAEKAELLLPK